MNNHLYKNMDVTNEKFGMLTAIRKVDGTRSQWVFRCDCGNEVTVCLGRVLYGWKKSCGCLKGKAHYKHGQRHNPIYQRYYKMIARCYSPKTKCYPQYGGRGITVCDEWRESFENFYKWVLENGYDPNVNGVYLSLDRIDNNKGYSPDNCRLVAPKVQQNNKRSNHLCEYKGGKYTLSQFAEKFNMDYAFVHRRIKQGYSTEQMIEEWELIVNKPDYYVHYCTYASQNNIPKERLRNMLIEGEIKGLKINSKWYVDTRDSNG